MGVRRHSSCPDFSVHLLHLGHVLQVGGATDPGLDTYRKASFLIGLATNLDSPGPNLRVRAPSVGPRWCGFLTSPVQYGKGISLHTVYQGVSLS